MTQPDPNPNLDTLKTLTEAFGKLPPLLSYGGLILIATIVILTITGTLPNLLLAVPIIVIVAFLVYAFMDHRYTLQKIIAEQKYELEKQKLAQAHEQVMAGRSQPNPPAPKPVLPEETAIPVTPAEWEKSYLRHLVHLCGYPPSMALVDIKEAGLGKEKLALERIFTSLDVPHTEQIRQLSARDIAAYEQNERSEREQRQPALTALSQEQNKHLVILGAPGSGKSTLVSFLTLCLAGDHLKDPHLNQGQLQAHGWQLSHLGLWPVRLILREYAARGLTQKQGIWDFIAADLSRDTVALAGYVPYLRARLQKEGGLLMLDGLDEVDKAGVVREALKQHIELFVRDFPQVRVVVTSRPYAYGSGWELHRFQVTRLLPFSNEQIEAFIQQWYTLMGQQDGTLGPEQAAQHAQGLIDQVGRIRSLHELAEHPLLLTMMVHIHRGREGGALPQRREELYRLSVILLLDLWRRSKTIPGQTTKTLSDVLGVDMERLLEALAEVAYTAHRDQPRQQQTTDIPGELVAGKLHKYKSKEAVVSVDEIIEYVRDRAGLLEEHGRNADDSDDVYRFPHRTFQEYLAAMHLLNAPDFPREMVELARKDSGRWREAVLLAGAAARPAMRWSLVESLYARRNAPAPEAGAAEADSWGAFLAGQVLLEADMLLAPPEMYAPSIKQVHDWHTAIVSRGLLPPRDRALAGELLAQLGDGRPGVLSCDEMRLCYVPPGDFWLGDEEKETKGHWCPVLDKPYWLGQYPVTVAQFAQFMQESGFKASWGDQPLQAPANTPVVYINWYDALAFCEWLNERWQKWLPPGYRVTLPGEAEWEKAARGGQMIPVTPSVVTADQLQAMLNNPLPLQDNPLRQRLYPWGDALEEEEVGPEETLYRASNESAGIGRACAVGSFPAGASPVGCQEMSGQVWEWTRTLYGRSYPYQLSPQYETVDPGNKKAMVLRGGAFYTLHNVCASRHWSNPGLYLLGHNGVRVGVSPFLASGL
jgi:formylglycine-generating enzyme required for sulfatase activity/energy-coupling factor transporter ATP-binding protein EcfA2